MSHARLLKGIQTNLSEALGRTLAQDVKANVSFPHFDNAAVDGFAIRFNEKNQTKFVFRGEIPAGQVATRSLKPGEAMAIFTGAPTPAGTDAVVMQEDTKRRNGSVLIQETRGGFQNIRREGEDFKSGDRLIPKGTSLEPQHIALLAALGHSKVNVIRLPRVAVMSTGSEIIFPGRKLKRGQIYDSNTPLLEAALKQTGAVPVLLPKVYDNLNSIRRAIRRGLQQDVLIVCGGVSVGKYDFVKEALRLEGVREIFWKIDIKPGKPVFFGKKGETLVFGLPGNPVSVFVTFEEFVKPALLKMMGRKTNARWIEGKVEGEYRNGKRPHFIRVQCRKSQDGLQILPLKGQGSHQIGTLAQSHGILKLEADQIITPGQRVRVKVMSGEIQ